MDKIFKVGIIGLGKMGLLHASILNAFKDAEVVAVAEPTKLTIDFLKKFKPELNIYKDYKDMLRECKLDLAVVTTPVSLHMPMALDCIRHHCHVFVEKPLALNIEECRVLKKTLEDNPTLRCIVGYCLRYRCTFKKMKTLIEQQILGPIKSFQFTMYSSDVCKRQTSWRLTKRESGGGVVIDLGGHILNLIVWCFGLPQELIATTERWYSEEVEDQVHACMWFKDGFMGWMDACWSMPNYRLPLLRIRLIGANGEAMITTDEFRIYLREATKEFPRGWSHLYAVDLKPDMEFEIAEEYYTLQLREAIDYCRGESDHLNAIVSIDPTQILIDSVYQSAEKNAAVNIQEP